MLSTNTEAFLFIGWNFLSPIFIHFFMYGIDLQPFFYHLAVNFFNKNLCYYNSNLLTWKRILINNISMSLIDYQNNYNEISAKKFYPLGLTTRKKVKSKTPPNIFTLTFYGKEIKPRNLVPNIFLIIWKLRKVSFLNLSMSFSKL